MGVPLKINSSGFGKLHPSCSVVANRWKAASMLVTLTSEFPKCIEFLEYSPGRSLLETQLLSVSVKYAQFLGEYTFHLQLCRDHVRCYKRLVLRGLHVLP